MANKSDIQDLRQRWENLIAAKPIESGLTRNGEFRIITEAQPQGDLPTEMDGIPVVVESQIKYHGDLQ